MNGPGVSLFQGADSIQLNNTNQREEEEEELLAEEKNRQAELNSIFQKAFDDLIDDDDDDSSLTSSHDDSHPSRLIDHSVEKHFPTGSEYSEDFPRPNRYHSKRKQRNFKENLMLQNLAQQKDGFYDPGGGGDTGISAHYEHCFRTSPAGQQQQVTNVEAYKRTEYNSIEQLKILHDCRLREIDRLNSELNAEREEKQQLVRKLTQYEEENKRLQAQHSQIQSLLSDSKNTIIELEKEVTRFKVKLKEVEKARDEAHSELEIAKVQILHQEEKYVALKRSDLGTKREKQMDSVVESLKAAHKKELGFLQQHLDAAVDRLNKKEDDYNLLQEKLYEMERKHAETLLSKCDSTIRQEATVKTLLDEANKEKLELMKRVKSLESQCSMLRADLEQYESVSQLKFVNSSSEEPDDSFQFLRSTSSGRTDIKGLNMNQTDLIAKYKDELQRALIGQRSKRKEIIKLQEMVQAKEIMINKMKEQERKYLAQTESLKADMQRIVQQVEESKYKNKDIQNDQLVTNLQTNLLKLETEKKTNIEQIKVLERQVQDLKNKIQILEESQQKKKEEYILFHEKEIEKLQKQNELYLKDKELEWGREMEKLMTESDEIKKLYMELKDSKEKLMLELKEISGKYEIAMKEKDDFHELLIQKQNDIKELEDRLVNLNKEKENLQKGTQEDLQRIIDNQLRDITVLKSQLEDITKTDAEELQRLRDEIELSKMRFVELEKTLRTEFETDIVKLKNENMILKENLKRKETEISLRKMCMASKNDVSTETDEVFAIETINEHNLAEIHKLENEIDRLRTLEKEKSQEILKLQSSYHEKIDQERKELAEKLQAEHLKEIELVEKRVKEVSLKYFSEEVEKMQVKHRKDIQIIKEDESKKFVEFKNLIHEKEKEVKDLKSSKERMDALLKKFEEERNKAAVIMTKWIKEIEEVKNEKEVLLKELSEFKTKHEEFKTSFENLKIKLKNTRKTALVYKRRLEEVRSSLTEKYNKLLGDIQKRVDEAIASREVEIENKFRDLEIDYKNKEKLLRLEIQRKQQH